MRNILTKRERMKKKERKKERKSEIKKKWNQVTHNRKYRV